MNTQTFPRPKVRPCYRHHRHMAACADCHAYYFALPANRK